MVWGAGGDVIKKKADIATISKINSLNISFKICVNMNKIIHISKKSKLYIYPHSACSTQMRLFLLNILFKFIHFQ